MVRVIFLDFQQERIITFYVFCRYVCSLSLSVKINKFIYAVIVYCSLIVLNVRKQIASVHAISILLIQSILYVICALSVSGILHTNTNNNTPKLWSCTDTHTRLSLLVHCDAPRILCWLWRYWKRTKNTKTAKIDTFIISVIFRCVFVNIYMPFWCWVWASWKKNIHKKRHTEKTHQFFFSFAPSLLVPLPVVSKFFWFVAYQASKSAS